MNPESPKQSKSSTPLPPIEQHLLDACIHCGLCLPACPTYLATGREMESPRGRIYLMNLWNRGTEPLSPRMAEHIDSCLGCLGCQTACPSGVQYGKILDQARPHLTGFRDARVRKLMRFVFDKILPDYPRLRSIGSILRAWQQSGADKFTGGIPWLSQAFAGLNRWQSFLPPVPRHRMLPRVSWTGGEKKGVVQLFSGCVMDIFYNQVNHACVRLLTHQRRIVQVPDQSCCGALASHAGELDIARKLAKGNIEKFETTTGEIVVTSAGCGAMLKGYGELLHHDEAWRDRAKDFASRVVDITEALASGEFSSPSANLNMKVAYHAACHLAHAQNARAAPRKLLSQIEGITLIPLTEEEHCCGSAGIFNLTHTDLSLKILERKINYIKDTGAQAVVTTNPGCLLQLQSGARAAGLNLEILHLAELLDKAYCS